MSAPTTMTVVDEDVECRAEPILEELGLTVSSVTNMFLKAVVRCSGLPFDPRLTSAPEDRKTDVVAEYLAPVISGRNALVRAGYDTQTFRGRLVRRKAIICRGSRRIDYAQACEDHGDRR